jgi:hypothetical protein
VLTRRPQVADFLRSGSWLRSRASRLMSGLGLVAISPEIAGAARKDDRRDGDQGRKNDDAGNNRDDREEKNQNERKSGQENDRNASAEDRDAGDKSDTSEKRNRDEGRSERDKGSDEGGSDTGKNRGDSERRNAESDANSTETSAADDDSHRHGGRHVREFEQQADDVPAGDVPDATTVTPANPNVVIDDIPSSSIADLVVEANDNVIASVSTSGGFAFARSGGVTAVTGPDGASIVLTGDVTTGTRGTSPTEPSDDGGNNDLDFSS